MFCVKCGKQTVGNEELCEECKAAENATPSVPVKNTGMLCFGKALASIIMGFGVFIISNVLNSTGVYMNLISMIFMLVIDVAAIVLALIFGGMAIRAYSTFKPASGKKPLPAFILGIIGVVLAGIAAVIVLVFLFVEVPQIPLYNNFV